MNILNQKYKRKSSEIFMNNTRKHVNQAHKRINFIEPDLLTQFKEIKKNFRFIGMK